MKEKGFSLLEVALVIMLIAAGSACMSLQTRYVEEVQFNALIKEVERGINRAQYMAISSGREYNILCTEKTVYIRPGFKKVVYKFDMGKNVTIPRTITGKQISFNGRAAPSKAGTIEFINKSLGIRARITIRVATGKTTIYYDKL